jgi:hypothetical protein
VRRALMALLLAGAMLAAPPAALAAKGGSPSIRDRVEELQQELDSLTEEVEDLREPVAEFDLFDQCMYVIGVSELGTADGAFGYLFGNSGRPRRRALAMDIRGFGRPRYQFLAFPAEEPPSIECNEDAGQEFIDARR